MRNRRQITVMVLLGVFLAGGVCYGGSIWQKKSSTSTSVYSDDKANRIGDILTIIISEDSKIDNKIQRDLEKNSSHAITFDDDVIDIDAGVIDPLLPSIPQFTLNATSAKSMDGKSNYKDERSFEDRMTVVVEDVHPNGNLVVIGTRERNYGGDKQIIQLSGIVRPRDIKFDNTVRSDQIAQFRLVTIDKGMTKDYTTPGWLARIFDYIWPL